jgi:hypothetical protein
VTLVGTRLHLIDRDSAERISLSLLASPTALQSPNSLSAHSLRANSCREIAAHRAGAAYDELGYKSNLLVLVSRIAFIRLNFVKKQLRRPVTNCQPGLTD